MEPSYTSFDPKGTTYCSLTFQVMATPSPSSPSLKKLSVRLLAEVIRERARDVKAHVVGLSLGAHVALGLTCQHPELVNAVFISGYEVFSSAPHSMAYGL